MTVTMVSHVGEVSLFVQLMNNPYALHLWGRFSVVLHQFNLVLHQLSVVTHHCSVVKNTWIFDTSDSFKPVLCLNTCLINILKGRHERVSK